VLSYIHVADEPADLMRELAIFFNERERSRILDEIELPSEDDQVDHHVQSILAGYTQHDLDFHASLRRVATAIRAARLSREEELRLLARAEALGEQRHDWEATLALTRAAGIEVARWDAITIAANCCSNYATGLDYPPETAVIPDGKSDSWRYPVP
jgi:hypothetical protein